MCRGGFGILALCPHCGNPEISFVLFLSFPTQVANGSNQCKRSGDSTRRNCLYGNLSSGRDCFGGRQTTKTWCSVVTRRFVVNA